MKDRVKLVSVQTNVPKMTKSTNQPYIATVLTVIRTGSQTPEEIVIHPMNFTKTTTLLPSVLAAQSQTLPIDVVLESVQDGNFERVVEILPGATPISAEEQRPAKSPGGFKKNFGGGRSNQEVIRSDMVTAAVRFYAGQGGTTAEQIIATAKVFEAFVKEKVAEPAVTAPATGVVTVAGGTFNGAAQVTPLPSFGPING